MLSVLQFTDLMNALNICLLNYQGGRLFHCESEMPVWFNMLIKVQPEIEGYFQIDMLDSFLQNFFEDASEFWQQGAEFTRRSGYWSVSDDREEVHIFNATAAILDTDPYLIINYLGNQNSYIGRSLQKIRDERLKKEDNRR